MNLAARRWVALRFGNIPSLRSRSDEHLPGGGAHWRQGIPVGRRRRAAPGSLRAIFRLIEVRLLDFHVLPVHVEFVRDDHGEFRLDSLPDLGILRHDRHDAIRGDANESVGPERGGKWGLGCLPEPFRRWIGGKGQEQTASAHGSGAEKRAGPDRLWAGQRWRDYRGVPSAPLNIPRPV